MTSDIVQSTSTLADPQPEREILGDVRLLAFLESDPRPSFVLGLPLENDSPEAYGRLLYSNPALKDVDGGRLSGILAKTPSSDDDHKILSERLGGFGLWIISAPQLAKQTFDCYGFRWTEVLMEGSWRVVSGSPINMSATKPVEEPLLDKELKAKVQSFDCTAENEPSYMSNHISWFRSIDWGATSLGPMSTWCSELRTISNIVLQDCRPAVVCSLWPDLIMIYNEVYIELLGNFHPCMGVSTPVALGEVWHTYFDPIIEQTTAGKTIEEKDMVIHMIRNGFMEESYFTMTILPVLDAKGAVLAHYQSLFETTRDVIAKRRTRTISHLSDRLRGALNSVTFWEIATKVLRWNDKDIPFGLLYCVEESNTSLRSDPSSMSREDIDFTLRGSFGLPDDSELNARRLELDASHGLAPYFREAIELRKPVVVQFDQDASAAKLVENFTWRGFGDPCKAAVICPLCPTSAGDKILGFIAMGLNPRQPYDGDYRNFVSVISQLLSISFTSILSYEDEVSRREQEMADAENMKIQLRHQLVETQKEVERGLRKFERFSERASVGIFTIDMDGAYTYRNPAWYQILAPVDPDTDLSLAWDLLIDDEHIKVGKEFFQKLLDTKKHQTLEQKLKRMWHAPNQDLEPKWVLTNIFPELSDTGEVLEIVGCITDISQQKWVEKMQLQQTMDAQESKRQLENFIDTTSHEMRNPLSAIVQCADSIIASHKGFEHREKLEELCLGILSTTVEAAETIVQCSKHMKTIVDDVLTMSKLDSGLFVMTPVDVHVTSIARDAVKMFEGEARAAGVVLTFVVENSCKQMGVDQVSVDPTRILQILINLITNAIKFTRPEEQRHVTVSLGTAVHRPLHDAAGCVTYFTKAEDQGTKSLRADWKKGNTLYIMFSVQDTGRGLGEAERDLLFARFSQASPRTHIDYGGSGLGLFISRRLTEMHGGAIGFSSQKGIGSTFSFYVKARRSIPGTPIQDTPKKLGLDFPLQGHDTVLSDRTRRTGDTSLSPIRAVTEIQAAASGLHILIVEDNLVNQRVLAKQLRNIGIKIAVANHGGEALDHLRTTKWCVHSDPKANPLSLILMDWEMPVMDGLTCVRNIRQLQKEGVVNGHVPVIAVTANVRSEQVQMALEAGMDDVISKPFRIPELCACIQKCLENEPKIGEG